jgi:hypothetical protein
MPKDNKRGDNVASSRSSSRVEKKNIVKKGEQHQQEFTRMIKKMFSEIDAQLEVEPKGIRINDDTLNNIINKKDKKKLN